MKYELYHECLYFHEPKASEIKTNECNDSVFHNDKCIIIVTSLLTQLITL